MGTDLFTGGFQQVAPALGGFNAPPKHPPGSPDDIDALARTRVETLLQEVARIEEKIETLSTQRQLMEVEIDTLSKIINSINTPHPLPGAMPSGPRLTPVGWFHPDEGES